MAKIIAGLGNPGPEYALTRHNIGFWVVDALAQKWELEWEAGHSAYLVAHRKYRGEHLYLIKPQQYMNNSGKILRKAAKKLHCSPENMMIVYDDLHLETAALRIRPKGSDGGHNGIKDLIEQLNTNQFPRMRIGIGNDFAFGKQADYVLEPFTTDQQVLMDQVVDKACDALIFWLKSNLQYTMNQFNS